MLDVIDIAGRKDALSKCKQLQEAISRFAEGDPALMRAFTEKLQAGSWFSLYLGFKSGL